MYSSQYRDADQAKEIKNLGQRAKEIFLHIIGSPAVL